MNTLFQNILTASFHGSIVILAVMLLRLVLKTPVSISPEQLRLLARLAPANARPAQATHGRLVREAQ